MKRFWKTVTTEETPEGWRVLLDGRPVSTPARRACVVPVAAIAAAIAEEWAAQEDAVRPLEMPMTRTAATCLDRVGPQIEEVRGIVAAYGESDLLCYRAEQPDALVARQVAGWDPVLDWAAATLGAPLKAGQGIMHVAQDPASLTRLAGALTDLGPWQMTAVAEMTQISGSLVLALAVLHGRLSDQEAWHLSRLDEQWNIEQWGEDGEAAAQSARREGDFRHSAHVLELLKAA